MSKRQVPSSDDPRTSYDPVHGLTELPPSGPNMIDAKEPYPVLESASRFRLSTRLLGHLERLAQATFLTKELTTEDFERWREVDDQAKGLQMQPTATIRGISGSSIIEPIAQSVYCSSAIEGEEILRKDVEVVIVGQAHNFDPGEPEAKSRATAIHDIYAAYIWALSRPYPLSGGQDVVITPQFICETHRIMFERTKGTLAGKYKSKDNKITRADGVVLAHMLPNEKVSEFMDAICDRINARFLQSLRHGSVSKLLSIAEFVCDFLAIHPFPDGNGRLARLLSTYLLDRADYLFARFYSLDAVILERHSEYYSALLAAQRNFYSKEEDLTPWIEYYVDCVYTQWIRAYQYIKSTGLPSNGG